MQFNKILIVCTGNICRSPIAEALFKAADGSKQISFRSAGTQALVGASADAKAQAVLARIGLSLAEHRARQISAELLAASDLILVADAVHRETILLQAPYLTGRVFKLAKFRGDHNIDDPYRKSIDAFQRAVDEIDACVADWVQRLR